MARHFTSADPIHSIALELEKAALEAENEFLEELARLGEMGVNEARLSGNYIDRTGNLRSSIGYVLAREGEVITASEFAKIVGKENPTGEVEGDKKGRDLATAEARRLSKDGYALVLVAGMEYASHVSWTGRNVLDSAEDLMRERIETRFAKLGFAKVKDE